MKIHTISIISIHAVKSSKSNWTGPKCHRMEEKLRRVQQQKLNKSLEQGLNLSRS